MVTGAAVLKYWLIFIPLVGLALLAIYNLELLTQLGTLFVRRCPTQVSIPAEDLRTITEATAYRHQGDGLRLEGGFWTCEHL